MNGSGIKKNVLTDTRVIFTISILSIDTCSASIIAGPCLNLHDRQQYCVIFSSETK